MKHLFGKWLAALLIAALLFLLLKENLIEINGKSGIGAKRSQDGVHDVLFGNMFI